MRLFRLIGWLILIPLALIFLAFSVANRGVVLVSFDPIPVSTNMPLYLLVFVAIFIGIIVGGVGAWLKAGKSRRLARHRGYEIDDLKREMATAQAQHETQMGELKKQLKEAGIAAQGTGAEGGEGGRSLIKAA